jgi:hypothetical protein
MEEIRLDMVLSRVDEALGRYLKKADSPRMHSDG